MGRPVHHCQPDRYRPGNRSGAFFHHDHPIDFQHFVAKKFLIY